MRAWRCRLWPATLAGRTILVLLCSLLALHMGSVWIHEVSLRGTDRAARERALAEGLGQAARTLAGLPEAGRDAAAHTLSTPGLELHWRASGSPAGEHLIEERPGDPELATLRERLAALPGLAGVRLGWADAERHLMVGALPLAGGGQLSFAAPQFQAGHGTVFDTAGLVSLLGVALGVGLVSVLVVRGLTRPLRTLAQAADRIGRDASPALLAEEGPAEVRDAARAFNAMQDRIRRLLEDRLQALAAVGHDLRTPLARLRLRAGFLEHAEARRQIDADLDDMERMVEATLGYLRQGRDEELARPADLVALVRTLCDAAQDDGATVVLDAPARLVLPLKRTAVRRALANLVENAASHGGGEVTVSVRAEGSQAVVEIADRGPGIPEEALDRVLDPFVRLEPSRNRATGGIGLGLAIARRAVEGAGGTLRLANRAGGGLVACVALPIAGGPPGRRGLASVCGA
ncbi:ATP-binding protein [Roseicella aquatilis]|uniref:histidine kinase n=1 Tax=Roseicella aquatilis TaxID=2527868 RepID=A0A4R4DIZ2_9PROT|nr:ATP-binding protein [Roseicella aquatilis]TCZ61161.1 HAMP domain-containing protein [Roseicella aquatilis]